jgi:hypothetical protein
MTWSPLSKFLVFNLALFTVARAALLDDFENGTGNNLMGGKWTANTDQLLGGNSVISNLPLDTSEGQDFYTALPTAQAGHTGAGMMIRYQFGTKCSSRLGGSECNYFAYARTSLSSALHGGRDLTGATGISFWAKSNFPGIAMNFIVGGLFTGIYATSVVLDSVWTKYTVTFDKLSNKNDSAALDLTTPYYLEWEISSANGGNPVTATFSLDDIAVEGYTFTPTIAIGIDPAVSANRRPSFRWHPAPQASNYSLELYCLKNKPTNQISPIYQISPTIKALVSDTFYIPTADLDPGYGYWRVKSDVSDWSAIGEYRIVDVRIPDLKPLVPNVTINPKPLLQWYPVTGAAAYTLQIATSSGFSSPLVSVPVSDTVYAVTASLAIGTYYWRVKSDLVSTWSSISDFTVQPDSIPQIVRFNGKATDNKHPVFMWNKVPGGASYRFMLADNRSYTNPVSVPLTDTTYSSPVDLASGKWYWKVSCNRDLSLFCSDDSLVIGAISAAALRASSDGSGIQLYQSPSGITLMRRGTLSPGAVGIYDLSGHSIASPVIAMENGRCIARWRFTDKQGRTVPAGIYLVRISTVKGVSVRSVVKK